MYIHLVKCMQKEHISSFIKVLLAPFMSETVFTCSLSESILLVGCQHSHCSSGWVRQHCTMSLNMTLKYYLHFSYSIAIYTLNISHLNIAQPDKSCLTKLSQSALRLAALQRPASLAQAMVSCRHSQPAQRQMISGVCLRFGSICMCIFGSSCNVDRKEFLCSINMIILSECCCCYPGDSG